MTINEPYYCTALYDMVRRPMQENSYGFTIILVILYGQMFMMCYDGSWIKWLFETSTPCLNEGHDYGFASSMGHPMSNSVRLLLYDGMHTYQRHWYCNTGPLGQS
jgi:hypothetical protein